MGQMEFMTYFINNFGGFLAVFLRLTGVFMVAPVFSSAIIPKTIKGMLILLIALLTFPVLASRGLLPQPATLADLAVIGAGELFVGYVIGFMVLVVITIFQISGQFYSIQMGFGIINVFDPLAETSVPIISQLKTLLMTIVFLLMRGHQLVLKAVFESYEKIPVIYDINLRPLVITMTTQFDKMFYMGFLIGLPLIGIVFLMTMSLGLVSKLAPQMNVMILGFGLKVMIGLFTFTALLPAFIAIARNIFDEIFWELNILLEAM